LTEADYTGFEWLDSDLFAVDSEETRFYVPERLVLGIVDVDPPEQPQHRTVAVRMTNGITLEVTAEYAED
jgi:hypothetical protein